MSDKVETVKVEANTPSGYKVINKSDMKESDRIYGEQKPVTQKRTYTKRK